MKVEWARVGDVLELRREPVDIDDGGNYRKVGIYSWGRGMIHYQATPAAEMGSLRYYRFPSGALMLSNIQAWEQAVAVTTTEESSDFVCSNRFLPYVPVDGGVDVAYLAHYLLSETGHELLKRASPGTQVRNRTLGKKLFEEELIPIPPLTDQRRIATHLDRVDQARAEVPSQCGVRALRLVNRAIDAIVARPSELVPMSKLADVNPRPSRMSAAERVAFVPMAAVDGLSGTVREGELLPRGDLKSGYKQFQAGDLLFARITPCMQNRKAAIYPGDSAEIGYGSTEFHVLRCSDRQLARWLHHVLRSDWFIKRAEAAFTGTAGQQRVPVGFLKAVEVPVPDRASLGAAITEVDQLVDTRERIRKVSEHRTDLAQSLLPAARNEIFGSMR